MHECDEKHVYENADGDEEEYDVDDKHSCDEGQGVMRAVGLGTLPEHVDFSTSHRNSRMVQKEDCTPFKQGLRHCSLSPSEELSCPRSAVDEWQLQMTPKSFSLLRQLCW